MPNSNTDLVGVVAATRVPDLPSREATPDVHSKLREPLDFAPGALPPDGEEASVPSPDIAALITQAIRHPCKRAGAARVSVVGPACQLAG